MTPLLEYYFRNQIFASECKWMELAELALSKRKVL